MAAPSPSLYPRLPYTLPVPRAHTATPVEKDQSLKEFLPNATEAKPIYDVKDAVSEDGEPKSFGHLMKEAPKLWSDLPVEMKMLVQKCMKDTLVQEMDADMTHAKQHYHSVVGALRLKWRLAVPGTNAPSEVACKYMKSSMSGYALLIFISRQSPLFLHERP